MQVETFECSETAAEPIEASQEAAGIIESLELAGQKALLCPQESTTSRCPYREMRKDERFVYGVLCHYKTDLRNYSESPIPLRVLQVAAHAHSLGMFRDLWVWHAASHLEKDPVLVGVVQQGTYTWEVATYILARWGEELESWPTLMKRACDRKREQIADALRSIEAKIRLEASGSILTDAELLEKGADFLPELRL